MSWIILVIALVYSVRIVLKGVIVHAAIQANSFSEYSFSTGSMLVIATAWVLPFYLNHWPTLY